MDGLGSVNQVIGAIKVDLMFRCKYRHPATKKHGRYTENFDCIGSGYHYVLGRYNGKIFVIDYIIHFTDFAKLVKKKILEIL